MTSGWPAKTLGEVCEFRGGGTPSKSIERYWHGDIPWVSPKDMKFDVVSDSIDHISREAIESSATSIIPKDSVLMVVRSGILARTIPIAVTGRDLTINQDLKALCPNGAIDTKFLYYLLHSRMEDLLSMVSRGATVHRLTTEQIRSLAFRLPPRPQQKQIVRVLDGAVDGIATARSNAERNVRNALAVFDSYLQSIFRQRGTGWVETTLGDIAQVKGGKRVPKGHKLLVERTKFPYLRVTDFNDSGSIDMSDLRYVSVEVRREIKNYVISSTDMYLSIAGTIGKTGIIPKELDGANLTENACRLVFRPGISNRFVYYFTRTTDFAEQAGLNTRTAAQPKLALSRLSTIRLGVPSLTEQESLADKFDSLRGETQQLQSIYHRKLAALEGLRKSVMHQAFTGGL
jgi:type I restriction enzyme S subunit